MAKTVEIWQKIEKSRANHQNKWRYKLRKIKSSQKHVFCLEFFSTCIFVNTFLLISQKLHNEFHCAIHFRNLLIRAVNLRHLRLWSVKIYLIIIFFSVRRKIGQIGHNRSWDHWDQWDREWDQWDRDRFFGLFRLVINPSSCLYFCLFTFCIQKCSDCEIDVISLSKLLFDEFTEML